MSFLSSGSFPPGFLRANAFRPAVLAWLLALAPACGGNDPEGGNNDPSATGSNVASIGAEGGSLIMDDITLTVPPGALSETKELRLEKLDASVPLPAAPVLTPIEGQAIRLTPHGTTFAGPVRLAFPEPAEGVEDYIVLRLDDESDTTWEELPLQRGFGEVYAETTGFSIYALSRRITYVNEYLYACRTNRVCKGEDPAVYEPFCQSNARVVARYWFTDYGGQPCLDAQTLVLRCTRAFLTCEYLASSYDQQAVLCSAERDAVEVVCIRR
jgi:hypothetical protein